MKAFRKLGYLAGASYFRRISEKLYVAGDQVYADHGLEFRASWFAVYYVLAADENPRSVVEIAGIIGFTHISVKNVLRELEERGLVVLKENPDDRRAKLVTLSAKGKKLLSTLTPVWAGFEKAIRSTLTGAHPDMLHFLEMVDDELDVYPLNERFKNQPAHEGLSIVDYSPYLKGEFFRLAGNWLLGMLGGKLEREDEHTLNNPEKAYLASGGFVFFAILNKKVVGCVALKRLSENTFEFAKLFVSDEARGLGVATRLIQRCITRCRENNATTLCLQTTNALKAAHQLYHKLGFSDIKAPREMEVLKRTEKIMALELR
jgi:DNA-binding MarR family transcriptional regulator/N-acetylglutamate synthase-like GNAT family acetyltransferase